MKLDSIVVLLAAIVLAAGIVALLKGWLPL